MCIDSELETGAELEVELVSGPAGGVCVFVLVLVPALARADEGECKWQIGGLDSKNGGKVQGQVQVETETEKGTNEEGGNKDRNRTCVRAAAATATALCCWRTRTRSPGVNPSSRAEQSRESRAERSRPGQARADLQSTTARADCCTPRPDSCSGSGCVVGIGEEGALWLGGREGGKGGGW